MDSTLAPQALSDGIFILSSSEATLRWRGIHLSFLAFLFLEIDKQARKVDPTSRERAPLDDSVYTHYSSPNRMPRCLNLAQLTKPS